MALPIRYLCGVALDNIQNIGFDYDYEEVKEVYVKAMFDER